MSSLKDAAAELHELEGETAQNKFSMSVTPPVAHVEIWPYVDSADALSESHAATAVLMVLSSMTYPSFRRVATDVFAVRKGRAAAARCGDASSAPRSRARPAELPEPDKKAPTPVTAAAALCGDDHQPSAQLLRVAAIAARMAREAAPAVQGQRRGIVRVRAVQDPNGADTLALRRASCNARLAGQEHQWGRSGMTSCEGAGLTRARPARSLFGHGWDASGEPST